MHTGTQFVEPKFSSRWRGARSRLIAVLVLLVAFVSVGSVGRADAAAGGSSLSAGQTLSVGQTLISPLSGTRLVMQGDGNLVAYAFGGAIWQTQTAGSGAANRLVLQGDGNLVVYTSANKAVWNSRTAGSGSANVLSVQDDGNLVLRTSAGAAVWVSGSRSSTIFAGSQLVTSQLLYSANEAYRLVLQGDGNLVMYPSAGAAVWNSRTAGSGASRLIVQTDGNLVLYTSANKAVWQTGTAGSGTSNRLVLQTDRNLVLRTSSGQAVWNSGTAIPAAPSTPQAYATAYMSANYGWGADQFNCLNQLWTRESDWNPNALNPSSGAFGIPQSLPGIKMASAGADWQTSYQTQIRWGLGYISGRYGNPCVAWSHWMTNNWY
jgi:hypothetical protein